MAEGNTTDKISYETVRSYLKAALEHLMAAGRSTHDVVEFALDKFGKSIIPYLKEFQEEIRERQIHVADLAESAKTAVFGIHVSPELRGQMIREAAYLRAERRGFVGGSPEEDWYAAEKEIDELLAKQAGILQKGQRTMASVTAVAEKELAHVRDAVGSWIESRRGIAQKTDQESQERHYHHGF